MMVKEKKKDIRKLSPEELGQVVASWNQPAFRTRQIMSWLWDKGARSFSEMSNLPVEFRTQLTEEFAIYGVELDRAQHSADGTIKSRYKLHDGNFIEAVLIPVPEAGRYTACVSTQVGCSLSCKFCATGRMKRMRNLEPAEIYDQVVAVNQQSMDAYGQTLTNIVYMGMGEPLLNYASTIRSIELLTSKPGLGISPKRITVSTAGIARMIRKLADDSVRFNLALSLHAADDKKRSEIMPINDQNNLSALMSSLEYFYARTRNRISFEYIAFNQFNDTREDAVNLGNLCQKFPVRVNIIEYNPIEAASFVKSQEDRLDQFARYLARKNINVTVRRSRGKDIDAACGQLANK